jgi:anti-anti-sigma factor
MPLKIQIEITTADRTARINLDGRLDSATAPELERELGPLLDGRCDFLIFDLARLEFISSAGIRVLVHARKTMRSQRGGVLMVNAQPQIVKVFDIIKALPGVSLFKSEQEMDAYLEEMQRRVRESGS